MLTQPRILPPTTVLLTTALIRRLLPHLNSSKIFLLIGVKEWAGVSDKEDVGGLCPREL